MATIKQTIAYIQEHPYYRAALEGDVDMGDVLWELAFSVWQTCSADAVRTYRANKRMGMGEIVAALRDMQPPCGLDVRLPIPVRTVRVEECPVVVLKVVRSGQVKRSRVVYPVNTWQLELWPHGSEGIEKPHHDDEAVSLG